MLETLQIINSIVFLALVAGCLMWRGNDEGDIVQIKGHVFQKKPGDFTGIEIDGFYPVTYTERMELVAGQWLLMHQLPYITVVGNVYEHLHLLERD